GGARGSGTVLRPVLRARSASAGAPAERRYDGASRRTPLRDHRANALIAVLRDKLGILRQQVLTKLASGYRAAWRHAVADGEFHRLYRDLHVRHAGLEVQQVAHVRHTPSTAKARRRSSSSSARTASAP